MRYVDLREDCRLSEPFLTPESEQDTSLINELQDRIVKSAFQGNRDGGLISDGQDVDHITVTQFFEEEIDGETIWCARVDLYEDEEKWNGGWALGSVSELAKVERVAARIGHGCRIEIVPDEPGKDSASILIPVNAPGFAR